MNIAVQRALVWTGPLMVIGWVGAFVALAGFIPPPDPELSPREVVELYSDDTDLLRLGLVLSTFACMLLIPFSAAIWSQMKRIEGDRSPLAMTMMCSAALLTLEFILPIAIWQTASYRFDEEDARLIQGMNDMGWIMFMLISSACVQFASLGICILIDKRPEPVFPRWAGYFNLWVAFLVTPAGIVVFFKDSPFAWNGLIGFFQPLTLFAIWIGVMFVLLRRAIDQEEREEAAAVSTRSEPSLDPASATPAAPRG